MESISLTSEQLKKNYLLSKKEKAMSKKRKCIRGHYFDGLSIGFGVGAIGGSLLFRGFGIIPGIIAIIFYFTIGYFEQRSYSEIKDSLETYTNE